MQTKLEAQVARLIRVTDTQAKKLAKLAQEIADLKKTHASRPQMYERIRTIQKEPK